MLKRSLNIALVVTACFALFLFSDKMYEAFAAIGQVTGNDIVDLIWADDCLPKADDTYDLGSATAEWKDLYIDGTANIDSLVADTADINGGTVDGATIGGSSAAAGTFTTLDASGASTLDVIGTVADSTNARTVTSADYGKTIFFSYAGAVAVTLPANGASAGSWLRCVNANSDTTAPTYSAATADTLITFNDTAADSVTFGTGHRIGSSVLFISNGSFWVAINESGSNTMTVNT